jgi:hypothetical protein
MMETWVLIAFLALYQQGASTEIIGYFPSEKECQEFAKKITNGSFTGPIVHGVCLPSPEVGE